MLLLGRFKCQREIILMDYIKHHHVCLWATSDHRPLPATWLLVGSLTPPICNPRWRQFIKTWEICLHLRDQLSKIIFRPLCVTPGDVSS